MRGRRTGIFTGVKARSESEMDLERALALARRHIRRGATWRFAAYTVALPALWAALWVLVSRFTLLELPRWPAAIGLALWLCFLVAWYWRTPVSRAQSARYLDRRLDLDDRLSTVLEIESRERWAGGPVAGVGLVDRLRTDTALEIHERMPLLRRAPAQVSLPALFGALVFISLFGALMIVPSPLDSVKAERSAVQRILQAQEKQIETLRADLVSRPGLPDALKASLEAELKALDAQLRASGTDRADALAAIAASEEKVGSLLPNADSSQYEPVVRAAQLMQGGAQVNSDWDPLSAKSADDIGRGAEATDHVSSYFSQFTPAKAGNMASTLERAAAVAGAADSDLGRALQDAAAALRVQDKNPFQSSLADAVARFRSAEAAQQSAQAVEKTLSKLDDGRQNIASAGTSAVKRQQVGFRRSSSTPVASGDQAAQAAQNGTPSDGGTTSPSGSIPRIGQNVPAFGGQPGGAGGQPPSQANTSNQPSGAGGSGQANRPASNSGSGAPGSGAGGSGASQNNPTSGQLTAPVRVGGTTAAGGGAAGNGVGGAATSTQTAQNQPPTERLYIPGSTPVARTGIGGQAAPENRPDAVEGKATTGDASGAKPSDAGPGALSQIKTPYTQVIGEYSEQATQALERAYIPPDAKSYVRDYFTELSR